jgi:hypothetical protein
MSEVAKFNLLIVDHDEEKFRVIRKEFDRVWGARKPTWTLIPAPAGPTRPTDHCGKGRAR